MRGPLALSPHFLTLAHVPFPFLRVHAVGIFSDFRLIENEMNVFCEKCGRIGRIKDQMIMITDVKIKKWNQDYFHKEFPSIGSPVTTTMTWAS